MDVWQRGTSFSLAASASYTYLADRWCTVTGANQAVTVSRQTTSDTTNLPNIQHSLRYQRNSGQTGTAAFYLFQSFENFNTTPFIGKTVTISFYAKCGANFSPTSSAFVARINAGTGTDQPFFGMTGAAVLGAGTTFNATTTWQRFAITISIASTYTQIAPFFTWNPTGTASTNDWLEVTGVQMDVGTYTASTAPTFRRSGGTIQGELAAAQRYCIVYSGDNTIGNAPASSTTAVPRIPIATPAALRGTPTMTISGTLQVFDGVTATNVTSLGTIYASQNIAQVQANVASGLTQYRNYSLFMNNGSLTISAEL
jgi:hypothetical protein